MALRTRGKCHERRLLVVGCFASMKYCLKRFVKQSTSMFPLQLPQCITEPQIVAATTWPGSGAECGVVQTPAPRGQQQQQQQQQQQPHQQLVQHKHCLDTALCTGHRLIFCTSGHQRRVWRHYRTSNQS